jgi:hypothetical protein
MGVILESHVVDVGHMLVRIKVGRYIREMQRDILKIVFGSLLER